MMRMYGVVGKERKRKEKMFIRIKKIWYYNVYILKLKVLKLFIPTNEIAESCA